MERLWYGEASMKYPKQWIVMVNMEDEPKTNKAYGDIYLVTPNKKEAYTTAKALGDSMGRNMVIEGFDDTPQIGGLEICFQ
ncbi:MAG: hypothetical protein FWG70_00780 [Oscillospiraceae bacterium]|nr:hypothetical protein [Oscillospiraceae bacterium]